MAQAQKRSFSPEAHEPPEPKAPPENLVVTPLAFWSNVAELQRQYLSSLTRNSGAQAEPASRANVTLMRKDGGALPAAAISQNWLTAAAEYQRELTQFMSDRLSKNQAFLASAAAMPGMQELAQLQAGWMSETAQDYTREFAKLSDIVKNGADEAIAATA